jgi:citrate lyase subunit beta/citryl-CoA lyase
MNKRSFLFVPGNRPERFDKACGAGADVVIIDLEDAVAFADKSSAREAVAAWLRPDKSVYLRLNGADTPGLPTTLNCSTVRVSPAWFCPSGKRRTDRCCHRARTIRAVHRAIEWRARSVCGMSSVSPRRRVSNRSRLALSIFQLDGIAGDGDNY